MKSVIEYFESIDPVLAAFYATSFTWALTAAGAALVFLFKTLHRGMLDGMLGFTGGVMVAASFWSLLNPAIEMSETMYPTMSWMPAAVGFLVGALFLFFLDKKQPIRVGRVTIKRHVFLSKTKGNSTNLQQMKPGKYFTALTSVPPAFSLGKPG